MIKLKFEDLPKELQEHYSDDSNPKSIHKALKKGTTTIVVYLTHPTEVRKEVWKRDKNWVLKEKEGATAFDTTPKDLQSIHHPKGTGRKYPKGTLWGHDLNGAVR